MKFVVPDSDCPELIFFPEKAREINIEEILLDYNALMYQENVGQ